MLTRRSFLPLLAAPAVLKLGVYMPVSSAKLVVPDYQIFPPYDGPPITTASVFKYDGETWVFTPATGGPGYPHLDFNVLYSDRGTMDYWWETSLSSSRSSGSSAA